MDLFLGYSYSDYLQPGTVIFQRYEVVKRIGSGNLGEVYCCKHLDLSGYLVAMRIIDSKISRDEELTKRLKEEILASYKVSNPYVVKTYEYLSDGDTLAYTMEYVHGITLSESLKADVRFSVEQTTKMLKQISLGIKAIHNAGIVHRDLKPDNILISDMGDIKISDFGIASHGVARDTMQSESFIGTIEYIAPEQLEDSPFNYRSDIYSIGIIAYQMLSGFCPFAGDSLIDVMAKRLINQVKPIDVIVSECPELLSSLIMKSMSMDPEDRFQNIEEFIKDLKAAEIEIFGIEENNDRVHLNTQSSYIENNGGIRNTQDNNANFFSLDEHSKSLMQDGLVSKENLSFETARKHVFKNIEQSRIVSHESFLLILIMLLTIAILVLLIVFFSRQ